MIKIKIVCVSNVQIVCVSLSGPTAGKLAHELVFNSPSERTHLKMCNYHNRYHFWLSKVMYARIARRKNTHLVTKTKFVRVFFSMVTNQFQKKYEPHQVIEVAIYTRTYCGPWLETMTFFMHSIDCLLFYDWSAVFLLCKGGWTSVLIDRLCCLNE